MSKLWSIAPRQEPDLLRQLLLNRGITSDVERFLQPEWQRDVISPYEFKSMRQAVARVFAALEKGEPITVHGDYDADGVSGSTVLFSTLTDIARELKYQLQLSVFLPDREKDGYGVAMHTVERLATEGIKLLITVDCGIANGLELNRAHELGLDTVICDHHQLGQHYPDKAIVLHPLAPGETYANKTLCGTGVAFKFAWALFDEARARGAALPEGYERWLLDLVAIATVTDVMPLLGENRALEYFGLQVLRKTRRPGLKAILASAGTTPAEVDTTTIGFRIGPRLNAAGRLASAKLAFDALAAPDDDTATKAAFNLERLNRERQSIFAASYEEAKDYAARHTAAHQVLVVYSETWLPGIVGLIAGRLVSDFGRPAFAFARAGEHWVGSGRSLAGLHLVQAMDSCGDMFVKRGGHPQACGLTVATVEHVGEFRTKVNIFAAEFYGPEGAQDQLSIDAEVPLNEMTWDVLAQLDKLQPFGEGNRQPVFAATNLKVLQADLMGGGKHLRLTVLSPSGGAFKFVGFGLGSLARTLTPGSIVDVAYEPGVNEWNGRKEIQFRIVDLKIKN